jgi:hypothetical protein
MRIEKTSIPHEGTVLGVQVISDQTYLLLAHGSLQILTCILQQPSWHIKLPLSVQVFSCDHTSIFLGGVQYTNAQRIHSSSMILCINNTGKLRWSYKSKPSKEEVWALLPCPEQRLIALFVRKTHSGHSFRHVYFAADGTILWEHTLDSITLQDHYCNPQRIPPKLVKLQDSFLCIGAFCIQNASSAVSIFSFDLETGIPIQQYTAPNKGALYTQSALSPKGHLAIAWQPFGKNSPNSGILLFDQKQKCIGEYRSYLHCWLGMTWHKKSLLISGKSRNVAAHPSVESIGKEKFFQEFKAHHLLGVTHLNQYLFFYLHQNQNKHRQLIMRDLQSHDPTILDEGKIIRTPFHGSSALFHAIAYNNGEESSTLIKVHHPTPQY